MFYPKTTTIKWVEVTNLKGDTYHLLPELLEEDGCEDYDICPSTIIESMDKAWELYHEALLVKLETNDPSLPLPNHYMQHIYNLHCYMKGDFESMDYKTLHLEYE